MDRLAPSGPPTGIFPQIKKVYSLNKLRQLVDLNGDLVNFEISFKIVSANREAFEALVADQTTLDSNPNLTFRPSVNGELSGVITHQKNMYQNFLLVMKAEIPCQVEVTIDRKELPPLPPPQTFSAPTSIPQDKDSGMTWGKILLIIAVVAAIGGVLYWYSQKSEDAMIGTPKLTAPMTKPRLEFGRSLLNPPAGGPTGGGPTGGPTTSAPTGPTVPAPAPVAPPPVTAPTLPVPTPAINKPVFENSLLRRLKNLNVS